VKKLIVLFLLLSTSLFLYAKDKPMSNSQYPDYTLCKIKDRKTIAALDGIWHDVKVEYDENGLVVYRGVHEKKSPNVQDDDWCVWKYTYDTNGRHTRIQGPLHGKFGWEDKTSDAYWNESLGTWDIGGFWTSQDEESGYYKLSLFAKGTPSWTVGYKPDYIRLIFEDTSVFSLVVISPKTGDYQQLSNVVSNQTIPLTLDLSSDYIWNIYCESTEGIFNVTKIEFGFNPFATP
jgi:YD repeat-containing protein